MSSVTEAVDDLVRVHAPGDEQAVLERAVETAVRATGADRGSALLLGPTGVTHAASRGASAVEGLALRGDADPLLAEPAVQDVLRTRCLVRREATHPARRGATPHASLGAPLVAGGHLLGALHVTRTDGGGFGADDEVFLSALARQAGWAVAGLRAQRTATELAERLGGSTGTATTAALRTALDGGADDEDPMRAVDRILEVARTHLSMDLAIASRIGDGVQRYDRMAGDADRFGVVVGMAVPLENTYCQAMLDGRISGLVPDAGADPFASRQNRRLGLPIGSYCGVPLRTPSGELYGSLCTLSTEAEPLVGGDLSFLRALADLVGDQLARHERRERARAEREEAVERCFAPGGLPMVVQPIVDVVTGRVAGVEALARPSCFGGPARAFAAAQESGRGADLELLAVESALRLLPELPEGVYLSVNASPATVCDERLLRKVAAAPAGRVVVEITEHSAVSDYPPLLAALDRLARLGVAVAVDDAGSGFASLQHVLAVSPQLIKLDVGLVRDVDSDPSRRALARAMVLFAGELGARLVAEGVETAAELATLRELGVRYVQGFHLARPAPVGEHDLLRPHV
ncbi:EAL domain-containing protein [Kineococcus glutinatus]|uniref:EAL domain-containing protein n=1 Tax=Kineococcus glutinatus TaxID=1070872 RepID=A0ABP9H932_9ACTN